MYVESNEYSRLGVSSWLRVSIIMADSSPNGGIGKRTGNRSGPVESPRLCVSARDKNRCLVKVTEEDSFISVSILSLVNWMGIPVLEKTDGGGGELPFRLP